MKLKLNKLFTLATARQLALYLIIFMLAGFIGNLWMTRNQQSGLMPSFVAEDITGNSLNFAFNAGRQAPLVVYFFADWCPICKLQNSSMLSISENYQVVGIAMQSGDKANVINYVRQKGLDFSIINDDSGQISRAFGVNGVPAVFIVDKTGQIRFSTRGYATEAGLLVRIWLASL